MEASDSTIPAFSKKARGAQGNSRADSEGPACRVGRALLQSARGAAANRAEAHRAAGDAHDHQVAPDHLQEAVDAAGQARHGPARHGYLAGLLRDIQREQSDVAPKVFLRSAH